MVPGGVKHNHPDVPLSGDTVAHEPGCRNAAYAKACSRRNEEEQAELRNMTGMRVLFAELHEADAKHRDETAFRKGIRALNPAVKFLNRIIDIANPISSFEPAAASGLAVAKSVATVRCIPVRRNFNMSGLRLYR